MSNNLQLPLILKKKAKIFTPSRRSETRVISKRGRLNVNLHSIPDKSARYVRDLWTTLVNMRWRWTLFTVVLVNATAYLLFTAFFLFDAWASGDFEGVEGHELCIRGTNHFTSYFMLGIETITTTGYGYFYPTEHCKFVWVVLTGSTLTVIFIDGAFISVVYAKISRPTNKNGCSLFSKKAVISLRNGRLCLIFRVNDPSSKHWIGGKVTVFLVRDNITPEGEFQPNHITELQIQPHGALFWPVEIVHQIDSASPLWNVSAGDLMISKFEILAVLTGSSVLTGNSSVSQTSYLSKEILWGYRFSPCVEYSELRAQHVVRRKNFNKTLTHDTPLCSAEKLGEIQQDMFKRRLSLGYMSTSSDHDANNNQT